jgi:hypothetical protein
MLLFREWWAHSSQFMANLQRSITQTIEPISANIVKQQMARIGKSDLKDRLLNSPRT